MKVPITLTVDIEVKNEVLRQKEINNINLSRIVNDYLRRKFKI